MTIPSRAHADDERISSNHCRSASATISAREAKAIGTVAAQTWQLANVAQHDVIGEWEIVQVGRQRRLGTELGEGDALDFEDGLRVVLTVHDDQHRQLPLVQGLACQPRQRDPSSRARRK